MACALRPLGVYDTSSERGYLNGRNVDPQVWRKVDTPRLTFGETLRAVLALLGKERGAYRRLAAGMGVGPRSMTRWARDKEHCPPARRRQIEAMLGLERSFLDGPWTDTNGLKSALRESGLLAPTRGVVDGHVSSTGDVATLEELANQAFVLGGRLSALARERAEVSRTTEDRLRAEAAATQAAEAAGEAAKRVKRKRQPKPA